MMTNEKKGKVLGVRLTIDERNGLEEIAKKWGVSVSSVARSYIQACLYRLPLALKQIEIKEQQGEIIQPKSFVSGSIKTVGELNRHVEDVKKSCYPDGLPKHALKGRKISIHEWNFVKRHRNKPCPCGRGKSYDMCQHSDIQTIEL